MRSLQAQTVSAFAAAVVLPLGLVCALLSGWFLAWSRADLESRADRSARELAVHLDGYLQHHRDTIAAAAELLSVTPAVTPQRQQWLSLLLTHHDGFRTMVIVDPDGTVVAGAPLAAFSALPEAERRVADRDYFQAALGGTGVFLSDAFVGRGFGADPIVALSRAFAWDQERQGVLEGSLDLAEVARSVATSRPDGAWTLLVVDGRGRLLAGTDGTLAPLAPVDRDVLAAAADARLLAAEAPLREAPWRVLVLVDRAQLFEPVWVFAAAMVGALLASALLAQFLFRRLQLPVIRWIAAVADRFASREADTIRMPPMPARAPAELRILSEALEELLATVIGQGKLLREHLGKLEERVQERTEQLEATNRELRHSRGRLEQFVRQAPVAIALFDRELRFVAVSDRWLEAFELADRTVAGEALRDVLPGLAQRWRDRHAACLAGHRQRVDEESLERPDGRIEWIRWAMDPWQAADGRVTGVVVMAEFVTEQKRLQDQLRQLADQDSLTGLLNRRAFLDLLTRRLSRATAAEEALLFVDLDGFKDVNDRLGHHVGDDVLRSVGRQLRFHGRASDVAGRFGGDEFLVLTRLTEAGELPRLVERYRAMLASEISNETGTVLVTVSVGAAMLEPGMSVEAALGLADQAMYRDKRERSG